ncbi:MAG: TA system VapC family ribonuclease toxin, partial [Gemmatimonadota bacterium]
EHRMVRIGPLQESRSVTIATRLPMRRLTALRLECAAVDGSTSFGVSELVLSAALRVLTHPRVFVPPTPLEAAVAWVVALRATPNLVLVAPGPRHWEIFLDLLGETGAIGNLIPDAWHAALALEHGCEWISEDADFGRFALLRWSRPG